MKRTLLARLGCGVICLWLPCPGEAHYMTVPYILPVPFWLYAWACAATLIGTFAILGFFFREGSGAARIGFYDVPHSRTVGLLGRGLLGLLRGLSVLALLLTIVAGMIGTLDPTQNIAMPLFWMFFLVGFTYFTALAGDLYALINPWRVLVEWWERWTGAPARSHVAYPEWLGYYPAFVFYLALIGLELFVLQKPTTLATVLIGYSIVNFVAARVYGKTAWFHYGELFSVFFRLIATVAPVEYIRSSQDASLRLRLRPPFTGALGFHADHMGLVLVVLFMLSSTTYDAIQDTIVWISFYWNFLIKLGQPLWGTDMVKAQDVLMFWYTIYKRVGLLLSPFVYLALYLLVLATTRALTRSKVPLRRLALDFAVSLVPIAVVYNVSHYYTLLVSEAARLPQILSDPFGFGWNLLGIERQKPYYIDMGVIWHTQVALILLGHMASVYVAHLIALRVFPQRRQAILSQVPMLFLMVLYTGIGLYVLSLPLVVQQLRE